MKTNIENYVYGDVVYAPIEVATGSDCHGCAFQNIHEECMKSPTCSDQVESEDGVYTNNLIIWVAKE